LGPLIGKVALVESAETTILTRQALHRQGLSALFRWDYVCQILTKEMDVVYEAVHTSGDDVFMIPLTTLLPVDMREHLRAYLTQSQAVINGHKACPLVTAAEVAEVVYLHERMYHPSSAVMARSLRSGAWLGVDL